MLRARPDGLLLLLLAVCSLGCGLGEAQIGLPPDGGAGCESGADASSCQPEEGSTDAGGEAPADCPDGGDAAACQPDGGSGDAGEVVADPAASCAANDPREVCEVFRLVNAARSEAGRSPLGWDPALARAAQAHAEDMVANNYFAHESQDGRSFSTRASDAGYDAFPSGENIAKGQQTAAEVMASWMDSEGHRNNILSATSNEIGIGLDGRVWVQVFGQR